MPIVKIDKYITNDSDVETDFLSVISYYINEKSKKKRGT